MFFFFLHNLAVICHTSAYSTWHGDSSMWSNVCPVLSSTTAIRPIAFKHIPANMHVGPRLCIIPASAEVLTQNLTASAPIKVLSSQYEGYPARPDISVSPNRWLDRTTCLLIKRDVQYTPVTTRCLGSMGAYRDTIDLWNMWVQFSAHLLYYYCLGNVPTICER